MKRILKTLRTLSTAALLLLPFAEASAGIDTHSSKGDTAQELFEKLNQSPSSSFFVPPEGWRLADPSKLPNSTEMMVIGKGKGMFPPSINLGTEDFIGTVQDYIKIVREICQTQGYDFKNLGTLDTDSGKARYCQTDTKGEWGTVRMLHLFLLKDGVMHIMTAGCIKEEFSSHREAFIKAMRSLKVNGNPASMVENSAKKKTLQKSLEGIENDWNGFRSALESPIADNNALFEEKSFQEQFWIPFTEKIATDFPEMNKYWRDAFLNDVRSDLLLKEAPLQSKQHVEISEALPLTSDELRGGA